MYFGGAVSCTDALCTDTQLVFQNCSFLNNK
jgi:hypothetical protein